MNAIRKLLAQRGFHYLATRFGPSWMRRLAFDGKFLSGDWAFGKDGSDELAEFVRTHCVGGDLLVMGCGGAALLDQVPADNFSSVLGIDISPEAIRLANERRAPNVHFEVADMVAFRCPRPYNVILFAESLNYVPWFKRKSLLRRLCESLKPGGCIVVTLAQPERYTNITSLIRRKFKVIEDRNFTGSRRWLMAFRGA